MVKVRVHLHEFMGDFMSEDCYVEITLPCRPMKGDFLHLSNENDKKMYDMALKRYTTKDIHYGEIEDSHRVKEVLITSGSDIIQIEIGT